MKRIETNAYGSARLGQGPSSSVYQARRAKLRCRGAARLLRLSGGAVVPVQATLFSEEV